MTQMIQNEKSDQSEGLVWIMMMSNVVSLDVINRERKKWWGWLKTFVRWDCISVTSYLSFGEVPLKFFLIPTDGPLSVSTRLQIELTKHPLRRWV